MSVTVEFLGDNAPYHAGDRAAFARDRAAALIASGVARLPPDNAPAPVETPPAPAGGALAGKTAALRAGTRKKPAR